MLVDFDRVFVFYFEMLIFRIIFTIHLKAIKERVLLESIPGLKALFLPSYLGYVFVFTMVLVYKNTK